MIGLFLGHLALDQCFGQMVVLTKTNVGVRLSIIDVISASRRGSFCVQYFLNVCAKTAVCFFKFYFLG